ncbi:DUF4878 domain-containing protein [Actinoplanes hulinensis]|uniref:DUF4878 domain-containing protein n=1 Tax=Actinoplanes hulinensis TaxID=1144547 RepID=A0ABS7BDN1_9ACTN|nr:DUF4878 domain-containing protein [Actinoplanes hulinensis]MBW6439027.1 DUF4878 domain-containing protein [Actinoplanes hulinensis]
MVMPMRQPVPPPPRRTLRTVVIVVSIVMVLCTCVAAGGYFFIRGIQQATGPASQAAEEFVADLESGNADAAYGRLCASTTSNFTREAFVQGLSGQSAIRSHEIIGVNVSNVNGRVSATVTANLTLDSGFVDRHTFTLVQEDGQWKVCGQPF